MNIKISKNNEYFERYLLPIYGREQAEIIWRRINGVRRESDCIKAVDLLEVRKRIKSDRKYRFFHLTKPTANID